MFVIYIRVYIYIYINKYLCVCKYIYIYKLHQLRQLSLKVVTHYWFIRSKHPHVQTNIYRSNHTHLHTHICTTPIHIRTYISIQHIYVYIYMQCINSFSHHHRSRHSIDTYEANALTYTHTYEPPHICTRIYISIRYMYIFLYVCSAPSSAAPTAGCDTTPMHTETNKLIYTHTYTESNIVRCTHTYALLPIYVRKYINT